ncbi:MaoC/PaaZ C-terminal domain-containing protein, partial [Acidovorax cavernicola]|uniref:MaoC/PaaZ C-terminal domain-containing protein n=1 Tax=Acidovorax cavernicola TaxID=1675792 RepID=UPI00197B02BC
MTQTISIEPPVAVALDQVAAGRYYWEDLPVGFRYQTASRTITEADIVSFAALTGDMNRAHVDDEAARTGPFGRRIAHGLLVVSYMAGLNTRTIVNQLLEPSMLALLGTECRFLKPTFAGDTIGVEIEVIEARPTSRRDRGIVKFRRSAATQRVFAPGRLSHSLFLFAALWGLWSGAGVEIQERFSAGRALARLQAGAFPVLVAVPSQLQLMLEWAQRRHVAPIAGVALLLISGARWMRERTPALQALFPAARIVEFYGASEASYIAWMDA